MNWMAKMSHELSVDACEIAEIDEFAGYLALNPTIWLQQVPSLSYSVRLLVG